MVEPLHLRDLAWVVTTLVEVLLLIQLIRKKLIHYYPLFSIYLLSTILQSLAMAELYRVADFRSVAVWYIAWGTQGVVVTLRALAVVELTRKILMRYSGLWALAWRVLLGLGVTVLGYTLLFSKGMSQWVLMNLVRGLELSMAAVIVGLLLFARYYRLPVSRWQRALAVGFCLYSAFYVINYSAVEKIVQRVSDYWNFLGILTFLASLSVWFSAASRFRIEEEQAAAVPMMEESYGKLSSKLNMRLQLLNQHLDELLRPGGRQ